MTSLDRTSSRDQLTVSVIVTNYNYGHYLQACLDSLRAQTRPPDEIIVVDDGSTDGSRDVLEACADVTVITQANGGQAAAFNTGFAASRGEVVIFVDADDKLYPQALEVVCRMWSREVSALSFGLSMVDGQGQPIGQYAMRVPDSDLLTRLLGQLAIPFMPTSGNAFRREAIEWAFPLPTERWRISADALLIRAAVLHAPIRQLRQVLGSYRVHGQNNYFRSGATGPWKANRGLRDIAQAGLDLISIADRGGQAVSQAGRAKLLVAASRAQLKAEGLRFDPAALRAFRRKATRLSRGTRATASLALYLWAAQYSRRLRGWAADPRQCPRVLMAVPGLIRGRALSQALSEPCAPRAPFDVSLSQSRAAPSDPMEWLTGPEWTRDHGTGGADLCAGSGRFQIQRAWPGPARLSLDLAPRTGPAHTVSVFHNGLPLGSHDLKTRETIDFVLPERSPTTSGTDTIELRTRDLAPGRFGALSRMWRKSNRLQVRGLSLSPEPSEAAAAVLNTARPTAMQDLGDVVRQPNGAVLTGDQLIGDGEKLALAIPPLNAPFCLQLQLSPDQAKGQLTVSLNRQSVCIADLVPSGQCLIEFPDHLSIFSGPAVLQFGFRPDDFADDAIIAIETLCWVPEGGAGRYGLPMLAPGGWAGPGAGRRLSGFLGTGWSQSSDGTAVMHGSSARLILSQAAIGPDAVLRLDLEPLDPLATQEQLVVVVSANGEDRHAVHLMGPAILEVDMSGLLAGPRHKFEVEIQAATRAEGLGDHGGLRLNRIGLAARPASAPVTPMAVAAPEGGDMAILQLCHDLKLALRQGAAPADLEALRDDLSAAVQALSPVAAHAALTAEDLRHMASLVAKLPLPEGDLPDAGSPSKPVPPEDWMRDLAQRMLHAPGFVSFQGQRLTDLPDLPSDIAAALGGALVADPPYGVSDAVLQRYQAHLIDQMEQARAILATTPEKSPRAALAGAMVDGFKARRLLFSDLPLRPHVEAFAAALEAKLLRAGHDLYAVPPARASVRRGKLRVGVLLHNTEPSPETWIWRAILRKLPVGQAELTIFMTEQNDAPSAGFESCRFVGLAGHGLAATVSAIRSADLDVVLLGANFYGHSFMTELCAHRLGRRQIALSAVFPATTGFSTTDSFVLGETVTPAQAAADYGAQVAWAPGAGQAFDIPQAPEVSAQMRAVTRKRAGVDPDAVMLVSGAMQDKVGPKVLDLWARILAKAPEAVLVLYPFAASWQQTYDAPAFQQRLAAACAAHKVDPRRIKVLPPIPNIEVKQVLGSADLYLDSFPYSGATTTVEALQCGLPVVAMQCSTQRGHQAAGWLIEFGLADLVAKSDRGYVKIAVDLAQDSAARSALTEQIAGTRKKAMGQHVFSQWFESYLLPKPDAVTEPRYLFHHMPKTGGTSLTRVLSHWFNVVHDYRAPWAYIMPEQLDLDTLGPGDILCGHFGADTAPLGERYPETLDPTRWRRITFLRDPLERAISIHAFEKDLRLGYDQTYEPIPLGEYLRSNEGIFLKHFECDETNWREALEGYWFIGTLERLGESLDYLAAQLGKPAPDFIPHDNTSSRGEQVSEEDIAIFRANNAVEYEIYDAAAARLDALLREHAGN
ncbi:MAG: glycosyltransferase [Pseudomonadota bacterium]